MKKEEETVNSKKRGQRPKFVPESCSGCGQTTNYAMGIDKGTAFIMISIAKAVRRLDRNRVHLQKELERPLKDFGSMWEMVQGGFMTSNMVNNASRARFHGLIAFSGDPGEYLLTPKGAKFLRGEPVSKTVIVSKAESKNVGYFEPHGTVSISELLKGKEVFWEGADINAFDEIAGKDLDQASLGV